MTDWTASELDTLDRVGEIRVAGRRDDGSLRPLVIVWHVVVDGALYVRSVRGAEGKWYQGVTKRMEGAISWGGRTRDVRYIHDSEHDDAVDAAYFAKYGRGSSTQALMPATARDTTLRIEPAE
jgi:hypothetical protein